MPLTDLKIKNLKPKEKAYKTADFDGLFVLVNPSGSKLFRFKYRFNGKEKLLSFGKYPDISLLQAREMRDEARRMLAIGNDPSEEKKKNKRESRIKSENTFAKIAEGYLDKISKEGRAEATMKKVSAFIAKANQGLGHRPIAEISSAEILDYLKLFEKRGTYETANRLKTTIGAVFRYAIANGLAENDPTAALKDALIRPKVKSRAAITDKDKLGGLLRSIDGYDGQTTTRIGLQLLAILAPRPSELRLAEWSEFNLAEKIWIIPETRMKMRQPHTVPLPDQAIALLKDLYKETGWGELLFPSVRSSQRPISENTFNAALRRMGYTKEEMTSHGFRATFSSLANESGLWHPDAIERALAHVERNEVRRAYARSAFWGERVKLSNWWAGFLDELRTS
jgi:integrase